ncbi:MAG: hypothetical protein ACLFWL_14525 [Candidatus Brocadiia bacterium]
MPAERGGYQTASPDDNGVSEEHQLALRLPFFGILVAILVAVAGWFVASALDSGNEVALTTRAHYAVRLRVVPSKFAEEARRLAENPPAELGELVGQYRIHLQEKPDGSFVLCAGDFASKESPRANKLLQRIRNYERGDERPFRSAALIAFTADRFR